MKQPPFEVLCIRKEEWAKAPDDNKPSPGYLEICTVTSQIWLNGIDSAGHKCLPGLYYQLAGYNPKSGFHSKEFITLPDQSADEMQEQEREAIVNLETA